MTALAGGAADKLGNQYELWWTVSEFVRMLHGQSESIRIEDPVATKAEFVVTEADRRILHQAKRSHPNGKWTLAALGSSDTQLLQGIYDQLVGNDTRFLFISGSHAEELDTLATRAQQSESLSEFEGHFIGDAKSAANFRRLKTFWGNTDNTTAYDVLKRIEVRTPSEKDIREKVTWALPALFLANPDAVTSALLRIAQESVHKTITREALIAELASQGYVMRQLRNVENASVLIETLTQDFLASVKRKLIRGSLIARDATDKLLQRIQGAACGSESVLTGRAGSGKTGCVIGLVEEAKRRGMAVLAIRLDRVKPVTSASELGRELGLEDSPALVLEAASARRPALLVIDQLDAVSTVSGRSSEFLDAVHGLLSEARALRERMPLHIVVVCRGFDWENDHRLRSVVSEKHVKVEVAELSAEEAKSILTASGFHVPLFEQGQIALLRLPQNLSLFLEADFDPAQTPRFNTSKALFDRYWTEKHRRVTSRAERMPDQWHEVIRLLCDEMTQSQQLSVIREVLDPYEGFVACMASEGVLTFDGRRYGFGHESFFDYCFARAFVSGRKSLADFVTESEQHLFRRAQVRQVLAYLRDADRSRYCRELGSLLSDQRVRAHLKDLALALVGAVTDPGEDEWAVLDPWVRSELTAFHRGEKNADKLASLVWLHVFRSDSWFVFLDSHGLIEGWLASGVDSVIDMGVHYLRCHERHAPDRVAALLESYVGAGGRWADRLGYVIQWSDHGKSRRLFDLLLRLIDDGTLDEARGPIAVNSTFWSMFHGLAKSQPAWVGEVLAHWLRRRRVLIGAEKGEDGRVPWRDLFNHDGFGRDTVNQGAANAPADFVRHILPVVVELSAEAVHHEDTRSPRRDSIWPYLMMTEHESMDAAVITALACALGKRAETPCVDLSAVIADLRGRNTFISNVLLLVLYTHGAVRYADEAAACLCREPWRFHCGYVDSPYWVAMELIRAIIPHCRPEYRSQLEAAVLAYVPDFERSAEGYKFSGHTRFSLLSCFGREHLSAEGQTRLGELERKFGKPESGPQGMRAVWVGSPIGKEAAERMTDEQWLGAIAKYDSEERPHRWEALEKGGAWQLASMLGEFTKADPERFARLCLRFPAGTHPAYMARVLDGLKGAQVSSELKGEVCRKVFAEKRTECGRSLADLLGSIEDSLPEDAISMLSWLATEHPDPEVPVAEAAADGDEDSRRGDVHSRGINSTRGRAAEAVCAQIWRDAGYITRFRDVIERLIGDRSTAVRSGVPTLLYAVASHGYSLALEMFTRLVAADECVLAAPGTERFVHLGVRLQFADVRRFVEQMLRANDVKVAEAGARLAGLAVLYGNAADDLVTEALTGKPAQRLGIAQVAEHNIGMDECREWCGRQLCRMFVDDDAAVRAEAASCFRQLVKKPLEQYEPLIQAFCDSAAYAEDTFSIFMLLKESPHRLPGLTCDVSEKFLNRFIEEAKDIRTRRAGDIHTAATLIFRTYQQHQNDAWAARCLDLIDRMCLEGVHDVREGLSEFDR
jgi:hypothetical protein